ncbi:MAG: DUF177 domain-containing protein [Bacillota bacterium]
MLRVNLAEAREKAGETVRYHFEYRLPFLEGPGETVSLTRPLAVDVGVTGLGGIFWVEGTVTGNVTLTCSRCLKPFVYPLTASFKEKYRLAAGRVGIAEEEGGDVVVGGESVDLTDKVRETILLALPMKALCDPACRGLCPECGTDLNERECHCRRETVDPRLAILAHLLEDKKEKEVT